MDLSESVRLSPTLSFGSYRLLARLPSPTGGGPQQERYCAARGRAPFTRLVQLRRVPLPPSESARAAFVGRAQALLRVEHNNLVTTVDAGDCDRYLFLVDTLPHGTTLHQLCNQARTLSCTLAVYLVRELLRGLHCAHASLPHGALTPQSVLLGWTGTVQAAAFPLLFSNGDLDSTMPGDVYGHSDYLSPEQLRGGEVHPRCDLFASGAILWELLSGRGFGQTLRSLGGDNPLTRCPPPSTFASGIDAKLDAIVMRALAHHPAHRWSDAGAMLDKLSAWLGEQTPQPQQEDLAAFVQKCMPDGPSKQHEEQKELLGVADEAVAPSTPPPTPAAYPLVPQTPVAQPSTASTRGSDTQDAHASPGIRNTRTGTAIQSPQTTRARSILTPVTNHQDAPTSTKPQRPLISPPEKLKPGNVVAKRYRIEARLGRGGMGTVYRAKHLQVGRQVALKVLARAWSHNEDIARRFRAEARAASAAGHPNIVEVFDAGELSDGRLYFVMEFLEGETLYHRLTREGNLSLDAAVEIMLQVARAIKAAHDVHVIHRDLKPDNVMLVDRGSGESRGVKVLDFGICAMTDERNETRWTKPGHAVGTPEYMAPEQARGVEATHLFDVYAWGVMFFEILCGRAPLTGTDFVDVMAKKNDIAAPSLGQFRSDAPKVLCDLIDDCLKIEPDARPQSMGEILIRLHHCAHALESKAGAVSAPNPDGSAPPEPPLRRRFLAAAACVGAAVACLGIAAWWSTQGPGEPPQDEQAISVRDAPPKKNPPRTPPAAPRTTPPPAPKIASLVPEAQVPPQPTPSTKHSLPAAPTPDAKTRPSKCESIESRILDAQGEGRSSVVLGLLRIGKDLQCWRRKKHRLRWARWRIHALKEQKRWTQCIRAASEYAEDQEVQQDLALCRAREALDHSQP